LELAIAEESKAQNAYLFYAEAANRADLPLVADVFLDIAQNEEEHARAQFGFLGKIRDTRKTWKTQFIKNATNELPSTPNAPKRPRKKDSRNRRPL